jgi:hypothetical protein
MLRRIQLTVLTILLLAVPTQAAATSKKPQTKKYSLGMGYAGSAIDVDRPRDGDDLVTLSGWGVRGRMQLSDLWAVQIRYLTDEQDFSGGGRLTLDQLDVQANFKMHESDREYFHVYATLGMSRFDFEERLQLTRAADRAFGAAVGMGLEYGPPAFAFFVDVSFTFVDLRLIPGDEESWTIGNTITGFAYRF